MPSLVKELMLKEYVEEMKSSQGFILTEFKGITVEQFNSLRRNLEKEHIKFRVFKNRLAKKAFDELKIEGLDQYLIETTGAAVTKEDLIPAAKILSAMSKKF
ncbi:50S ribosomal protein L10, partial [bacterium]|nr:50S ribosomal protein L10 [bacterium]